MMEDAIRRFAQENFSHKYFPVLHGETEKVQPLALVVKQHRSIWKRPFAKMEMVILAGFERYVEKKAEEAFRESVTANMREEELAMKQKIDLGYRYTFNVLLHLISYENSQYITCKHLLSVPIIDTAK